MRRRATTTLQFLIKSMRRIRMSRRLAFVSVAMLTPVISALAAETEGFTIRAVPLWLSYPGTIFIVICSIRIGFLMGSKRQKLLGSVKDEAVSPVSAALMGLLAFMLAFSFNLSMNRFESRKMQYLDQVNAIETFYRRADLFPEKYRTAIQSELMAYVDVRLEAIRTSDKVSGIIEK